MLSARKQIRIISLGEVVTPNVTNTIQAFKALILSKKLGANPLEVEQAVSLVLHHNMKVLNSFQLGTLNEDDYTQQMINALETATQVKLTSTEFNEAWHAMHPKFKQFEALLTQAVEYNKQPNQQIIFISSTNPKDIRNLIHELESNKQNYRVDGEQLVEICGIQLHTSYPVQKTKAELIETVIKSLNTKTPTQSNLANSMSNVLSLESAELDIKYIRCVNSLEDPILKADMDKINQAVEKKADAFRVETILWMKKQQTLSDVLCDAKVAPRVIYATRL